VSYKENRTDAIAKEGEMVFTVSCRGNRRQPNLLEKKRFNEKYGGGSKRRGLLNAEKETNFLSVDWGNERRLGGPPWQEGGSEEWKNLVAAKFKEGLERRFAARRPNKKITTKAKNREGKGQNKNAPLPNERTRPLLLPKRFDGGKLTWLNTLEWGWKNFLFKRRRAEQRGQDTA